MRMNGGISMRENAWKKYDEKQLEEIFAYCEGYKKYISDCKTERDCGKLWLSQFGGCN